MLIHPIRLLSLLSLLASCGSVTLPAAPDAAPPADAVLPADAATVLDAGAVDARLPDAAPPPDSLMPPLCRHYVALQHVPDVVVEEFTFPHGHVSGFDGWLYMTEYGTGISDPYIDWGAETLRILWDYGVRNVGLDIACEDVDDDGCRVLITTSSESRIYNVTGDPILLPNLTTRAVVQLSTMNDLATLRGFSYTLALCE